MWPLVVLACLRLGRGRLRVLVGVCVVGHRRLGLADGRAVQVGRPVARVLRHRLARAHDPRRLPARVAAPRLEADVARRRRIAVQVLGVVGRARRGLGAGTTSATSIRGYYGLGSLAVRDRGRRGDRGRGAAGPRAHPRRRCRGGRCAGSARSRTASTSGTGRSTSGWSHWRVGFGGSALNALRLAVTFAFATASYYLVERPIRQGRFLGLRRPQLRWVAPAGIVLVGAHADDLDGRAPRSAPTLLRRRPDPIACPRPARPSEQRGAARRSASSAAGRPTDPDGRRAAGPARRRLDRVQPVARASTSSARPRGCKVDQAAVIGCGIASGEVVIGRRARCRPNTADCPDLDATRRSTTRSQRTGPMSCSG